jgi:hypothetical protein
MKSLLRTLGLTSALLALSTRAHAMEGLRGSEASMIRQHAVAVQESYAFTRTPADVQRMAGDGELVPVIADGDFTLAGVSFAVARPEVRAFVMRFARDYHDSTGATLTVTSLTRPYVLQPRNAHKLSVHPAGMAIDFRVPATGAERDYLERSLLGLEKAGMLDVTRERVPAHYHVAVFAEPTLAWLARRNTEDAVAEAARAAARGAVTAARSLDQVPSHRSVDAMDESRLPWFVVAMALLLGLASLLLQQPGAAVARH